LLIRPFLEISAVAKLRRYCRVWTATSWGSSAQIRILRADSAPESAVSRWLRLSPLLHDLLCGVWTTAG